jgi:hypothetical protein
MPDDQTLRFDQIHIDVARNATDDFNPFHDPRRWRNVERNPFGSTIALGFQMEFLAADRVARLRLAQGLAVDAPALAFSNYDFLFADALRVGEAFELEVKKTVSRSDGGLSNRVILRREGGRLVLMGTQSESAEPRFLADVQPQGLPSLEQMPDRVNLAGTPYFLKRKFLNTANGKNFAVGALCDQFDYFDELSERIHFAPLFTAALISSALLEKGRSRGYDFEADPLVYTAHQISVDNALQQALRSNHRLDILVEGPLPVTAQKGLGRSAVEQQAYHCLGLVHGRQVLFRARVLLAPLHAFLAQQAT